MILYFLRHASAGEHFANPKKDEKRPLDADGIEQCGVVGRALAALNAQPDVIISSPLKRATQTASLVGNELGYEGKLLLEAAMRPEASFADFSEVDLEAADLSNAKLYDAKLIDANLEGAKCIGAVFSRAALPSRENSSSPSSTLSRSLLYLANRSSA